jgi:uncharacterized sulfatase
MAFMNGVVEMDRRDFLRKAGLGAAAVLTQGAAFGAEEGKEQLNILFILADDLGWAQLGCYGSRYYETPNIDRLGREGVRFTDAYAAAPVCSPTRASIATGKYPARLHLTDYIPGYGHKYERLKEPEWKKYLGLEELTIAEALKMNGYATGMFGKWHLSIAKKPPESEAFNPEKQGFDESLITYKPRPNQDAETDAHNVKEITERAAEFLEKNRSRPFFLFVSHNTIHTPIIGKTKLVEKYRKKVGADLPENNPVLAAMIEELDDSVGSLLKKLDESGIGKRTVVVFFSDNGGLERAALQKPLRSGKGNLYEGGIRVPLIVRWPGVVRRGSECKVPVISCDFFPTFLEIAGSKGKGPAAVDGESLVPLLEERGSLNRGGIYWHYPHYHRSSIGPCGAVRAGDYKLIEWIDESICGVGGKFELYNLKEDIGEKNNLANRMPHKVKELRRMLEDWRGEVGAQEMVPNPDYEPEKAKKSKRHENGNW